MAILGFFLGIVTGILLIAVLFRADAAYGKASGRSVPEALRGIRASRPVILDPDADKGSWDAILDSADARREE